LIELKFLDKKLRMEI